MTDEGRLKSLERVAAKHMAEAQFAKAAMSLFRALAQSDKNKKMFCEPEGVVMRLVLEVRHLGCVLCNLVIPENLSHPWMCFSHPSPLA